MFIGAHVSSAGGIANALRNAQKLGVAHLQTFLSAPQSYNIKDLDDQKIEEFLTLQQELGIKECYAHAIYLLNFASEKPIVVQLSKENLTKTLNLSAKVKFNGVIIHIGSAKSSMEEGIAKVSQSIKEILETTDPNSTLYLENSAGSGNCIGSDLNHLVEILNFNNGNPRLKVCFDTQHAFASGILDKNNVTASVDNAIKLLGDKIQLIHLNDSKTEFNSNKDRHENIGLGNIGLEAMKEFCTHPFIAKTVKILEVPGMEGKGPDIANLDIVRNFYK